MYNFFLENHVGFCTHESVRVIDLPMYIHQYVTQLQEPDPRIFLIFEVLYGEGVKWLKMRL